jgi:pimeloyl-ACP methyl ester carboxylesterase
MKRTYLVGILALLALLVVVLTCCARFRKPPYLQNFGEEEYSAGQPFVQPRAVRDGLAIYSVGQGEPLLLFPYPHAQTTSPMAQGALAELLAGLGRTVVTFDVPGAYRSTREPVGDMAEMLRSAEEALDGLGIVGPVDVVGHSMGGLCALAFAIERPARTRSLTLVGSLSGFPAAARWGLPGSRFQVLDPDYWRLVIWGLRVKFGWGDLALHKKLQNLMVAASYYDPSLFRPVEIDADDHAKGVPAREVLWGKNMLRRLSYADRLGEVRAPTLVLVGRHDPETPLPCSKELEEGIPDSALVVFEASGHFPFIEEPELVADTVAAFLSSSSRAAHSSSP